MLEARLNREQELLELMRSNRSRLVQLYEAIVGSTTADRDPDIGRCLHMIQTILDHELPNAPREG
jgi:hypothetical protein